MITLKLTRYFVHTEGHEAAVEATYSAPEEKYDGLCKAAVEHKFDFPDLGGTWREMTDEEAADYYERHKNDGDRSAEDESEDE